MMFAFLTTLANTGLASSEACGCHKPELIEKSISPGRRWTARIERQYCSDGWLTSDLADIVSVARTSAPKHAAPVLVIGDDGHAADLPTVSWPGDSTLRIEVVGYAYLGFHRSRLGALRVIIGKHSGSS